MPLQFSPFEKCHCNSQDSSKNATFSLRKMPLQWHFSKDENCSGISQFRMNCSGIYLIYYIIKTQDNQRWRFVTLKLGDLNGSDLWTRLSRTRTQIFFFTIDVANQPWHIFPQTREAQKSLH